VFGMGDELQLRDTSNNGSISTGGRVDIYVTTSPVPVTGTQIISATRDSDGVFSAVIPADVFPGAYGVTEIRREGNAINAEITHVLGHDSDRAFPLIRDAIHARYSKYQTLTVQFEDSSIASATTEADFEFDVLYMPNIANIQEYMEGVDIRSYGFDTLVKATVPIIVDTNLDIEYAQGITPPSIETIQQSVSDVINRKVMGDKALYSSDIVYAVALVFPEASVRMPVNMFARAFMPDGSQAYSTDQNRIQMLVDEGISPENSTFFNFASGVDVKLTEIKL